MIELPPGYSDAMWGSMCAANMGLPEPLPQAARAGLLARPFVYDRERGVFPVPYGSHNAAMRVLLGWRNGCETLAQMWAKGYPYRDVSAAADAWLELPGTAFRSSLSPSVQVWKPDNLTQIEKRVLGPDLCYVGA